MVMVFVMFFFLKKRKQQVPVLAIKKSLVLDFGDINTYLKNIYYVMEVLSHV